MNSYINSLDQESQLRLHFILKREISETCKWKFYITRIQDCDEYVGAKTVVYANSRKEAMEKLAYIWNHGGNPEDTECDGVCEENFFLAQIIPEMFDSSNGNLVRVTPEELDKIIFKTGCEKTSIYSANTMWSDVSTYPNDGFKKINVKAPLGMIDS